MISLDPKSLDSTAIYKLLIGGVVPRPIALISTQSPKGQGNLAPFSFFNAVSSNPPALMVAITYKKDGAKKDTLINIEATGQFVVNVVSESIIQAVNQSSGEYPYGVNEMLKVGLTPLASVLVKPPRVQESPMHFECELLDTLQVGPQEIGASTIVVGKIVQFHIREDAYSERGHVSLEALAPISRLGGLSYGKTTEVFDLPRPKV